MLRKIIIVILIVLLVPIAGITLGILAGGVYEGQKTPVSAEGTPLAAVETPSGTQPAQQIEEINAFYGDRSFDTQITEVTESQVPLADDAAETSPGAMRFAKNPNAEITQNVVYTAANDDDTVDVYAAARVENTGDAVIYFDDNCTGTIKDAEGRSVYAFQKQTGPRPLLLNPGEIAYMVYHETVNSDLDLSKADTLAVALSYDAYNIKYSVADSVRILPFENTVLKQSSDARFYDVSGNVFDIIGINCTVFPIAAYYGKNDKFLGCYVGVDGFNYDLSAGEKNAVTDSLSYIPVTAFSIEEVVRAVSFAYSVTI